MKVSNLAKKIRDWNISYQHRYCVGNGRYSCLGVFTRMNEQTVHVVIMEHWWIILFLTNSFYIVLYGYEHLDISESYSWLPGRIVRLYGSWCPVFSIEILTLIYFNHTCPHYQLTHS